VTNIDFEDIVVPPGGTVQITNQYASELIEFSAGLHTDTVFPPFAPGVLGAVAATNGDPGCCPTIEMTFLAGGASSFGFNIVSLDDAATELEILAVLGGVSTSVGTFGLDTSFEIKFFGVIDPATFDSIVIRTLLPGNVPSGFVIDNLAFTSVPEPGTLTLLGVGLAGLAARARRSRRG
jgi:hypothetical protein